MSNCRHMLASLFALVLLGGCATANAQSDKPYTRVINQIEAVTPATEVALENLVGHVNLTQGGTQLNIRATVVAGGEDASQAKVLADLVSLAVSRDGNQLKVHVNYPVDAHDIYRYISSKPEREHTDISFLGIHISSSSSDTALQYQGHGVRVVQGSKLGVPLHVDLDVQLPAGVHADIRNHVGMLHAKQLDNALTVNVDSGDVHAEAVRGSLAINSQSGDSRIDNLQGDLSLHAASGDVSLHDVHGRVDIHSGSGDISGSDLKGDAVAIKAGSGDIDLHDLRGALHMQTGSGDIDLNDINGSLDMQAGSGDLTLNGLGDVTSARLQCGSGDIHISGNLSGLHDFALTAGSGDVNLSTSTPPAVHLDIIAGGDIDVRWNGVSNVTRDRRNSESGGVKNITRDSWHTYSGDMGTATGGGRIRVGNGDVILQ